MIRWWRCWLGRHEYVWVRFNHTTELWACACGRAMVQFGDDPLAMTEVESANEEGYR